MTAETESTIDAFRPSVHYSTKNTWVNDPNGLIHHNGRYHLFYQNNPCGSVHGNLSWGHATSTDLIAWEEQPLAIPCDDHEEIFSGSVVLDELNSTGFSDGQTPPLVAIYTSHYKSGALQGLQAQSLAWSPDGGYTWTKYHENPVLNRNSTDFRDPKVFRYDGSAGSYWVMAAVEALDHKVVLYRSDDLKNWEYLSHFGPANGTGGIWECPDLFPLPLDADQDRVKWVLTLNMNPGGPNEGSAGQYFVGHFDGVTFTSETTVTEGMQDPARLREYNWLDWGRDYYAAVSFNNVPDGRRLMIAWMNNWQYAQETPPAPWRSPMSLVREISLVTADGQPRLRQRVVPEITGYATGVVEYEDLTIEGQRSVAGGKAVQMIEATFVPGTAEEFGLVVRGNGIEGTRIGIRPADGVLKLDRKASGDTGFSDIFASVDTAPVHPVDGAYKLRVFVDHCSVEVFAEDGLVTLTDLIFPSPGSTSVSLYAVNGNARASLKLTALA